MKYKKYHFISLGSDCNPSHVIKKLGCRRYSMPFDWLDIQSEKGLEILAKCIANDFNNFFKFSVLKKKRREYPQNAYGHVFYHHVDIADNKATQQTYLRRITRFKNMIAKNEDNIFFLYTVKSKDLNTDAICHKFQSDAKRLQGLLKHPLWIYISYNDRSQKEDVEKLLDFETSTNIKCRSFFKNVSVHRSWGSSKDYPALIDSFLI